MEEMESVITVSNWTNSPSYPYSTLSQATFWMILYIQPIIFCVGIIGNILSFIVFLSTKMRQISTNVYLSALSASNSVFLLAVGITWTDMIGMKLLHHRGVCKITVYLTYCSIFISVWIIVCIAIENFLINFCLYQVSKNIFQLLRCLKGRYFVKAFINYE